MARRPQPPACPPHPKPMGFVLACAECRGSTFSATIEEDKQSGQGNFLVTGLTCMGCSNAFPLIHTPAVTA